MKVFWSWQSDHPGNISRHLIREALELAVASLNEDLALEEPDREATLDHDRKGVPGSPDLAAVIFEKIRNSDAFVADVTPVGSTSNDPPKKLMNPNVAIELGYALHTITDRRLIMVMNGTFGQRSDLPFDLQHKGGPLFYSLRPDATKEQIKDARKQLMADFKVALREMVPHVQVPAPCFKRAPSVAGDPGRYFPGDKPLVVRTGLFSDHTEAFHAEKSAILYLRLIPTSQTTPLKRAEAHDLIRQGPLHLNPFYYHRGGSSFEANEFGAIAFDANYDEKRIVSAAQLFLNREIWAFNTVSLSPKVSRIGQPGVPTQSVEETFAVMLREYLTFMSDKLGVKPPYSIEAGATGVRNYVMFMPPNFVDRVWGPIHQDSVTWEGILETLESATVDRALLSIFEAFFDAAACKRPEGLYGFPGAKPGAIPR